MSYLPSKLPEFSPAVVVEPWRKALMDAADRVRERGWCQRVACDGDGRVCLLGAIFDVREAAHTVYWAAFARSPNEDAANRMIAQGLGGSWNDAPERTAAEVIAALEAAARS